LTEANLLDERKTAVLREQFIAVLGHDLRNPLAAINGGMRLLLRKPLDDEAVTLINMIQSSVGRMAGLINDVMDFARGRLGGGLTLDRQDDAPIEAILRQVATELQISMPDRVIETHFKLSAPVNCDSRRMAQLASNLLGNALTHGATDKPVRMSATTADGWFELFVANAGDPIPAVVRENIFQPFSRQAHRPSQQGLGLGLYIAHQIAEAHGGTIGVVSTPAETRFTFRMPLSK
jgi:signal transduction histidine kinase